MVEWVKKPAASNPGMVGIASCRKKDEEFV